MLKPGPAGERGCMRSCMTGNSPCSPSARRPVPLPADLGAIAAVATTADADANYASGHHYLIRPYGYVALSTGSGWAEPIVDFLRKIATA